MSHTAASGGEPPLPNSVAPPVGFTSREELKKQRELEEARKSGLIPAEKDEEGKDINPHIPQYISKAPWYLSQDSRPSLKHQRFTQQTADGVNQSNISLWYKRGVRNDTYGDSESTSGNYSTKQYKFRKGACENCGSMTHVKKDCTERPRKKGAKFTGQDLRPDEYIEAPDSDLKLSLDFDGKRDRYGGYDTAEYDRVIRDYELVDLERKKRKAFELQEELRLAKSRKKRKKLRKRLDRVDEQVDDSSKKDGADDDGDDEPVESLKLNTPKVMDDGDGTSDDNSDSDSDSDSDAGDSDDEDVRVKDFDQTNAPVGSKDDRIRTTTRNLRIREDTAKYLFNLDVNSAFYDPKTRSMRDNPLKHLKPDEQGIFKGDNMLRKSGEADCVQKMEVFAWQAYKHGVNVHSQAQPTHLELMNKEHQTKRQTLVEQKKANLFDKYGGKEHMEIETPVISAQTEIYVEYTKDGTIKKGRERQMAKSKYIEDLLFGDHRNIWGSWFDKGSSKWGYKCCHCFDKNKQECIRIQAST